MRRPVIRLNTTQDTTPFAPYTGEWSCKLLARIRRFDEAPRARLACGRRRLDHAFPQKPPTETLAADLVDDHEPTSESSHPIDTST
jgi:hypothetical protein